MKILAINPGSTSTKIGVFDDDILVMHHTIRHTPEQLAFFPSVLSQFDYRRKLVIDTLEKSKIPFDFDVIVGRGGLLKPIEGGVYRINEQMLTETRHAMYQHACNLGSLIAADLASRLPQCEALTADPGVVDGLDNVARICGSPQAPRFTIWHALNQRAIARRYAKEHHVRYDDLNLIVVHLGGGISLAAHRHGRAVDANNALAGDGPFGPERSGSLLATSLIDLCFSGRYTHSQMLKYVMSQSGMMAHLGTNNVPTVLERIRQGDEKAKRVLDAMIYQVAKGIGGLATVFYGKVDAILVTGGIANSTYVTDGLIKRVSFVAPVFVYPGEDELTALAMNALCAMRGELELKEYR